MSDGKTYGVLLRRELTRAQARLKRAERECDRLRDENRELRALLSAHGIAAPPARGAAEPA